MNGTAVPADVRRVGGNQNFHLGERASGTDINYNFPQCLRSFAGWAIIKTNSTVREQLDSFRNVVDAIPYELFIIQSTP